MKLWTRILTALVLLVASVPAARAEPEKLVHLHPDSADRYRPAINHGRGPLILADIDSITSPAIAPDGRRVAFSGALGDESLGRYAIFVVNSDGSGLRQLTNGDYGEFDPAWSWDGKTVVAAQNLAGSITPGTCCRLITIDVDSGESSILTNPIGAVRPSFSPSGAFVVYDRPNGVWRIPSQGGIPTRIATIGWDATVSPDSSTVAYLAGAGGSIQLRLVPATGGSATTIYSTTARLESPVWLGDRIYFIEHRGLGYDGRNLVRMMSIGATGGEVRTERSFSSRQVGLGASPNNDEIFFYRNDGLFQYFDISPHAHLGPAVHEGTGYSTGWSSITSVDLDGDGRDELLFYRAADGVFKYYETKPGGGLGALLAGGSGYSTGWSSITSVDLDGDGRDELLFYRAADGVFKYYETKPGGGIGNLVRGGSGYSIGWSSITSIDLDGDGQDEIFFYRSDGTFRYYDISPTGVLGAPLASGSGYTQNWTAITSVNLDG